MRARRVLLAGLLALLVACGGSTPTAQSSTTTTTTTTSSTVATSTTAAPSRPFTVTRRDITIEDTSRPTNADEHRNIAAKPSRTLPVMLLVPDGPGPFPLVEFSHGVTSSGPQYEPWLEPIAAAGYVIAAPTFPLSSGPGASVVDYVNQPADVYFVIDSVLKMAGDPNDALHGRVDAEHLAVAGHSLGAMTTYGTAFNSCCAQARIDAAIVLSGVEAPFPDGNYDTRPPVPLLLAHGGKDTTIVPSSSDNLFAASTGPTAFVRFPDGTHSGIFGGDSGKLLDTAVIGWLDKWLRNDSSGFDGLDAAVTASGIATLQTKGL
jgi:dipeptidyl aminopeptidase/acylaminoacyl peptidase